MDVLLGLDVAKAAEPMDAGQMRLRLVRLTASRTREKSPATRPDAMPVPTANAPLGNLDSMLIVELLQGAHPAAGVTGPVR